MSDVRETLVEMIEKAETGKFDIESLVDEFLETFEVRPHGTVTDADRAAINGALIEGLPLRVGATEQGHARKALLDGVVAALEARAEARP